MNFPKNFAELMPYIVFVIAMETFYSYMLWRHVEEVKKLRGEKAALLEILLAFLRHKTCVDTKESCRKEKKCCQH